MKILATYKGTGGRCSEDENLITPRFAVAPVLVVKAIKAQVHWLEKPAKVTIRREGSKKVIGRAIGYVKHVDVEADHRSIWHFQFSARRREAVWWIAKAFQVNLVLTIKRL